MYPRLFFGIIIEYDTSHKKFKSEQFKDVDQKYDLNS